MVLQVPTFVAASDAVQHVAEIADDTMRLSTDGTFVVWDDRPDDDALRSVFVADLRDGTIERVGELDPDTRSYDADVSGGIVVWTEERPFLEPRTPAKIKGRDLATGKTFTISESESDHIYPSIHNERVTWLSIAGSHDESATPTYRIMLQNVRSMESATVVTETALTATRPQISGDYVVWEVRQDNSRFPPVNLYVFKISTGETRLVLENRPFGGFELGGSLLIYRDHTQEGLFVAQDLDQPGLEPFAIQTSDDFPRTDGRYIVHEARIGQPDPLFTPTFALLGRDLISGREFMIDRTVPTRSSYRNVAVEAGTVAWVREQTIHAADLHAIEKHEPGPAPGESSPYWIYFPETEQFLSYAFKDFWLRNGGLPVFGFPLTEEFQNFNSDIAVYRTVQYLERQRFEYHPELAGTPYETLLGRLGHEDAIRRGLYAHPAFQRLPAGTQTDANTDFFPVTGHRISHGFRDYWRSHGLDLGDEGVSYRESVALFGYPISDEFVDPETGLVTQYFERAVFEYHPDNPDPYKVLLRRLGAEEMIRWGWIPAAAAEHSNHR